MKVKDLLESLSTLNPDAVVILEGYEGGYVTLEENQIIQGEVYHEGDLTGLMCDGVMGPHLFSGEGRKAHDDDIAYTVSQGIKPIPAVLLSRWFEE